MISKAQEIANLDVKATTTPNVMRPEINYNVTVTEKETWENS